jgi:two-component system, LytTR family, response regulator
MSTVKSAASRPAPTSAARPAALGLVPRPAAPPPRALVATADRDTRIRVTRSLERVASVESPEIADGAAAIEAIRARRPDVVFVDVALSGLSGFEVLAALEPGERPAAVLLTSERADACRAFEADAADCVVRPFDAERISAAFARAQARREGARPSPSRKMEDWLLVKKEGRSIFVRVSDIDWIESARNNVILHVGPERYVHHETTSGIEARLDPNRFLRIHRSAIVRIDRVKELAPWFNGDYRVTLKDGTHLTLSESYRGRLKRFRA